MGIIFFKTVFFSTLIFKSFFVIFPWSHDLEQVTSISAWLDVRRTPEVEVPGIEETENYWHLYT